MSPPQSTEQRKVRHDECAVCECMIANGSGGWVAIEDYDELGRECTRLTADLALAQGLATSRNERIALIADERDRLRKALEAIAAFNPGEFRPLADEVAIWKQATDALKVNAGIAQPVERGSSIPDVASSNLAACSPADVTPTQTGDSK